MNESTKKELQEMRDNIAGYVERMTNDQWRCDFDATRYQADIARLDAMITNDQEPTETAITLHDLHSLHDLMRHTHDELKAIEEPLNSARYRSQFAGEAYMRALRRHGEDSQEAQEARAAVEEAHDAYKTLNDSIDDARFSQLAKDDKILSLVFANAARLHVQQCAQVATLALVNDDSWTTQPTRYKRMRRRVEAICDEILCGTGCRVSVYESGKISVNHAWDAYFTHVEYSHDVEIQTFAGPDELPNLREIEKRLFSDRNVAMANATMRDVMELCTNHDDDVHTLRYMRDEYQRQARNVMAPYRALGFDTSEMERAYRI